MNHIHQQCLTRLIPLYTGSVFLRCPKCKVNVSIRREGAK